jgi:hypothetical protein
MAALERIKNWNSVDFDPLVQENGSDLDLEVFLRKSTGRQLIDRGVSVIFNPDLVSYSGVAGLHGTSIENVARIIKNGRMIPRTNRTITHGYDNDDKIYIVPFAEAFEFHHLRDRLERVQGEKVVNTAKSYASTAAFYSYFEREMPEVISSIDYVLILLMPDSGMASRTVGEMRRRARELGYDMQKFDNVFETARNRKGAVLAVGTQTLSSFDYHEGDGTPGREVYIKTRTGLPLEAITGIEVINSIEKQELLQRL